MITRATLSTIEQGLPKYRSMLAGNAAFNPYSFESIATVTVGSGGTSSITFSSIPQTYASLQIRSIARNGEGYVGSWMQMTFNGSSSNYVQDHYIEGYGSGTPTAGYQSGSSWIQLFRASGSTASANVFAANIVDILDYTSTNKNKTVRGIGGVDNNSSTNVGMVAFHSGLWRDTSAITSITIAAPSGQVHSQYSHFALYGIKGA